MTRLKIFKAIFRKTEKMPCLILRKKTFFAIICFMVFSLVVFALINNSMDQTQPERNGKIWVIDNGTSREQDLGGILEACEDFDQIYLGSGVYTGVRKIEKKIDILARSKQSEITIIVDSSGIKIEADTKISGITFSSVDGSVVLDICKGSTSLQDCTLVGRAEFGIRVSEEASVVIRQSKILGEFSTAVSATGYIGINSLEVFNSLELGIYLASTFIIHNCIVKNSGGTGILISSSGRGDLTDSQITKNTMDGIEADGAIKVRISDCEILGNKKAGLFAHHNASLEMARCLISRNGDGARVEQGAQMSAEQCVFSQNRDRGVAIINEGSGTLVKCDSSRNIGSNVLILDKSTCVLQSSKVYKSKFGSGVVAQNSSECSIYQSMIFGNRKVGIALMGGRFDLRENNIFCNQVGVSLDGNASGDILENSIQLNRQDSIIEGTSAIGKVENNTFPVSPYKKHPIGSWVKYSVQRGNMEGGAISIQWIEQKLNSSAQIKRAFIQDGTSTVTEHHRSIDVEFSIMQHLCSYNPNLELVYEDHGFEEIFYDEKMILANWFQFKLYVNGMETEKRCKVWLNDLVPIEGIVMLETDLMGDVKWVFKLVGFGYDRRGLRL